MRLAVLASGSGTLLEAMLEAGLPIVLVVVDRECRAVDVAEAADVAMAHVERASFGADFDRDGYTARLVEVLEAHDVDLVVMAGFGTVLASGVFERYEDQVLNTHPALLPAFPGWHAVRDALDHGVKVTGCTVHLATEKVDDGPILAQEAVPVLDGDDEATLHERIKTVERRLYVDTVRTIVERGAVR